MITIFCFTIFFQEPISCTLKYLMAAYAVLTNISILIIRQWKLLIVNATTGAIYKKFSKLCTPSIDDDTGCSNYLSWNCGAQSELLQSSHRQSQPHTDRKSSLSSAPERSGLAARWLLQVRHISLTHVSIIMAVLASLNLMISFLPGLRPAEEVMRVSWIFNTVLFRHIYTQRNFVSVLLPQAETVHHRCPLTIYFWGLGSYLGSLHQSFPIKSVTSCNSQMLMYISLAVIFFQPSYVLFHWRSLASSPASTTHSAWWLNCELWVWSSFWPSLSAFWPHTFQPTSVYLILFISAANLALGSCPRYAIVCIFLLSTPAQHMIYEHSTRALQIFNSSRYTLCINRSSNLRPSFVKTKSNHLVPSSRPLKALNRLSLEFAIENLYFWREVLMVKLQILMKSKPLSSVWLCWCMIQVNEYRIFAEAKITQSKQKQHEASTSESSSAERVPVLQGDSPDEWSDFVFQKLLDRAHDIFAQYVEPGKADHEINIAAPILRRIQQTLFPYVPSPQTKAY